jgi:membrane dipeptidase
MTTMGTQTDISERTSGLLKKHLVWDNHGCMPLRAGDYSFLPQLERYRKVGVDVVIINAGFDLTPIEDNLRVIAGFRDWLAQNRDRYIPLHTVVDISSARREGKLAVGFNIEGCCAIGDQLSMISLYYDLGVRWMLIAYNRNNPAGGGCQDDDKGLTAFGRQAVDEMAKTGMITCCSHTGYRTALDVMAHASNPVILSHSNPRALVDHPRNVPDEVMQACAETGGVMGINGVGLFLGDPSARPESVAEHIDYAVQKIGPQHVGMGFDYCFDQAEVDEFMKSRPEMWPQGMNYGEGMKITAPEDLPVVVECLVRRGYPDDAISGILGGNFLRVASQVWK